MPFLAMGSTETWLLPSMADPKTSLQNRVGWLEQVCGQEVNLPMTKFNGLQDCVIVITEKGHPISLTLNGEVVCHANPWLCFL